MVIYFHLNNIENEKKATLFCSEYEKVLRHFTLTFCHWHVTESMNVAGLSSTEYYHLLLPPHHSYQFVLLRIQQSGTIALFEQLSLRLVVVVARPLCVATDLYYPLLITSHTTMNVRFVCDNDNDSLDSVLGRNACYDKTVIKSIVGFFWSNASDLEPYLHGN